jgi:uncharacterized membrane protein
MVGQKPPIFSDFFQRKIRNNVVYYFIVSLLPILITAFVPLFAVFTAVLAASKLEAYGTAGTTLSWVMVLAWVIPIQLAWYFIVNRRLQKYLALLIDRKPINVDDAKEYIIEKFKKNKDR